MANRRQTHLQAQADNKHFGSIVDAEGNEIPITEAMITKACDELETEDVTRLIATLTDNLLSQTKPNGD